MKKLFALLLAAGMFVFAACNNSGSSSKTDTSSVDAMVKDAQAAVDTAHAMMMDSAKAKMDTAMKKM